MLAAACSPATEEAESAPSSGTTASTASTTTTGPDVAPDAEADPGGDDDGDPETEGDDDGADGATAEGQTRELLSELGGQLAIGNGPVIAVARPDGQRYVELDGGQINLASQPTWSADGSALIWGSVSALAQEARVQNFDDEGVADGERLITNIPGQPVFYFQWRGDGDEVAYLRNSTRSQTVEAGVLTPGGPARWMADGDPFFVAWAPTEPVLAAHVADERVAIFDPQGAAEFGVDDPEDTDEPDVVPGPGAEDPVAGDDLLAGGGFSTPAWLDDETLLAVVSGTLSKVDIETGRLEELLEVDGPVRFVLSPDRTQVAFQAAADLAGEDDVLEVGSVPAQGTATDIALLVVDITDGGVEVVTDRPVVAWEWSPDSAKLAWLELDGPMSRRRGRWRFWSADGPLAGDSRSPTVVLSIKEMVNYLPFFAQYSFSLQRWAPDSSAFAIVGSIRELEGVWIQLVDVPAEPVLVAPGDVVSWGFGPTPTPDAGRSPA